MVVRVETCGAWPRMLAGLAGDQTGLEPRISARPAMATTPTRAAR